MIIVTGGAGFIGSNLVKALNQRGIDDILVVDNLQNADKVKNLADLSISDYMDKHEFADVMASNRDIESVSAVFHEGACSDTMASDGKYVLENNFTYSKLLFRFCQQHAAQYIYASSASVYGAGEVFVEEPSYESTLNAYAYSKLLFDNFVRHQIRAYGEIEFQCVGLRYFNVYGPREQHKGRMASVAWHFYHQYQANKQVKLFAGSDSYADGEQLRDFVSVHDVVKVNLFLLDNPHVNGIFNVGTGRAQSFNDVAIAVVNRCRNLDGESSLSFDEAISRGEISYVAMPEALHGKYQSYTCADMSRLKKAGYSSEFDTVETGVFNYVDYLTDGRS
ncbi:MAG: ADP-glyceromanno-heptose 6-epimerase [Gammaproteobacteria bacterium]|nr:ADP-glyceromanno-heptose 6-epimerase [Gammaproteobacteria bacterium]